jgi:glycosyltransferase 2 family protein
MQTFGDIPVLTACAALAVVLGFVSFIPGGFGVRELVVTTLLAPLAEFGTARALAAAVLLRVIWLLSELFASAILMTVVRGNGTTVTVVSPAPVPSQPMP